MYYIKSSFFLLLISCCLFSCKKFDINKISQSGEWNPKLAIPLAYSEFGIKDILSKDDTTSLVQVNPATGEIAIIYKGDLFSFGASDFAKVNDFEHEITVNTADLSMPMSVQLNETFEMSVNQSVAIPATNDIEIHSMQFHNGSIELTVDNYFKHDLIYTLSFPNLTLNGQILTQTLEIPYQSGVMPNSRNMTIDLSNVQGNFNGSGAQHNMLAVKVDVKVVGLGNEITGSEKVYTKVKASNIEFENIYGYFGEQSINLVNDSLAFNVFENLIEGDFKLVNPKIKFTLYNSFGFPIKVIFENIKTRNMNDGAELSLLNYQKEHDINYASAEGNTATSHIYFNRNNTTNLEHIITPNPKHLFFNIDAKVNPYGLPSSLNFITRHSKIRVNAEVEVPAEGLASGFRMIDTINFSFNEDLESIENIMFRLSTNNGFPLDIMASIIFLDENDVPIFTLFNTPEHFAKSGLVDQSGKVNERTKKITDISLDKDQISSLKNAKKIVIYAIAQTLDAQNNKIVKFYDDYGIGVRLAMQVHGKFQF